MATLTGETIVSTYEQLLKITSEDITAGVNAKYIEDGKGTDSALSISTTRVGIGTATPGGQLHIKGDDDSDQVIIENTNANSNTAPDLVLYRSSASPADADNIGKLEFRGINDNSDDFNYGNIYVTADDVSDASEDSTMFFNVYGAGAAKSMVFKSGNVGIGTDAPSELLHLKSSTASKPVLRIENAHAGSLPAYINLVKTSASEADDDFLGVIGFKGLNDNDDETEYAFISAQSTDVTDGTEDSIINFGTMANAAGTGSAAASINMVINGANVGIGTNAPAVPLQVIGTNVDKMSAGTAAGAFMISSADGNYGLFGGVASGGWSWLQASRKDSTATNYAIALNPDGGKVGIGTTSPGVKLHVEGEDGAVSQQIVCYSATDIAHQPSLSIRKSAGSTPGTPAATADDDLLGIIQFCGVNGAGTPAFDAAAEISCEQDAASAADISGRLVFKTADAGSPATKMTILSDGKVGIGAPTPLYPLEVTGNGSSNFIAMFDNSAATSTSHGIRIKCGDTDHADSDTHYIEFYESDAGLVGELDSDSGNLALSDTSDYRLKENVNLIIGGLAKINALKPSTFNYKKYPNKVHEGFIAHEVQEAGIGYAVKGEKDAMKTEVTPAVEAREAIEAVEAKEAVLDEDGNIVEDAVEARAAIAAVEAVAEKTEQVDSNQLLAITNLIPQMVSAIQELSAKVTALENA